MDRKNYKIKDIAAMAGVSVGTVDRVLHNRGDVSEKSRKKVEQVLEKILYRPNLLVSSIGVKRKITLAIVLPSHQQGEYWEQIEKGIHQALYDFSKIRTETKTFYYDQFDLYSCRTAYSQALEYACDVMIIGPTFREETPCSSPASSTNREPPMSSSTRSSRRATSGRSSAPIRGCSDTSRPNSSRT